MRGLGRGVANSVHFRPTVRGFGVDAEEDFAVVVEDEREEGAEEHDVLEGGGEAGGAVGALDGGASGGHGGAEWSEGDWEEGWREGLERGEC